eukprot:jgi/Botrbrau1/16184/Bobra.0342s0002.1
MSATADEQHHGTLAGRLLPAGVPVPPASPTPLARLTGIRQLTFGSMDVQELFNSTSADEKSLREWLDSLKQSQPDQCDMADRSPLVSLTKDGSMMAELLQASWEARQSSMQVDAPTSGGPAVYKDMSIVSKLLQEYAAEAGCHGPLPEPSAPIQAMETPAEPPGLSFAAVAGSLPAFTVIPGESGQDPALPAKKSSQYWPPVAWPPSPFAEAAAAKQLPVGVPGRPLASSAPPPFHQLHQEQQLQGHQDLQRPGCVAAGAGPSMCSLPAFGTSGALPDQPRPRQAALQPIHLPEMNQQFGCVYRPDPMYRDRNGRSVGQEGAWGTVHSAPSLQLMMGLEKDMGPVTPPAGVVHAQRIQKREVWDTPIVGGRPMQVAGSRSNDVGAFRCTPPSSRQCLGRLHAAVGLGEADAWLPSTCTGSVLPYQVQGRRQAARPFSPLLGGRPQGHEDPLQVRIVPSNTNFTVLPASGAKMPCSGPRGLPAAFPASLVGARQPAHASTGIQHESMQQAMFGGIEGPRTVVVHHHHHHISYIQSDGTVIHAEGPVQEVVEVDGVRMPGGVSQSHTTCSGAPGFHSPDSGLSAATWAQAGPSQEVGATRLSREAFLTPRGMYSTEVLEEGWPRLDLTAQFSAAMESSKRMVATSETRPAALHGKTVRGPQASVKIVASRQRIKGKRERSIRFQVPMMPTKRVAFCGEDGPEGGPGSSDDGVVPATAVTEYSPEDLAKLSPEERKQVKAALRREKNRASAKRSLLKKEAYNTELEKQVKALERKNEWLTKRLQQCCGPRASVAPKIPLRQKSV